MSHYNPAELDEWSESRAPIHDRVYFARLRRKLRWQMLFAYLTPLILISVVFHLQYNTTLREGIDNHLKSIADHQRNIVDLYLRERVANLRSAFRFGAPAIVEDRVDMRKLLGDLQQESPAFVDVGLFDSGGKLVAYAGPHKSLIGKNYSGESWWRRLQGQKRAHLISDVYLGFRRRPHFVIAVRHVLGGRQWTIRASVDPKRFSEFVRRSYLIKNSDALIVNAQGKRQTIRRRVNGSSQAIHVPKRNPTCQVQEVTFRGRSYVTAYAWLTEHDWVLVVRVPESAAYAPLRRATYLLIGAILLAVLLIVVLVMRNSGRMVRKLEQADLARADLRGQLFHAAKLASVGEMAAGVAHEINNPLAIIYEETGMMKDSLDPQFALKVDLDDFAERLDAIEEAALRGRSITRKLLAFARQHESGVEPTDLNVLLERVLKVKDTEFKVSNIETELQLEPDLPEVQINRNQLDQVVINLLNNAKDAMVDGGRITIKTRSDANTVGFEIQDSGCGMTSEQLENAFFPFYTTKDVGKGTGLGLSISYGIVSSMDGSIDVDSEVGRGTTFTVSFPRVDRNDDQPKTELERNT